MEDCDISVNTVGGLSTVAFSVVFHVADFEGDGGGVLVSGGVEEGAAAVVAVVGESHNCCFLLLFVFVSFCWFVSVFIG
uniref:Transmembrane protein n=1 Tax=Cutibacterium phage vB_CacS-HV1 TaxID=3236917 RepID=A0AB39CFK4_9CAUD